MLSDDGDRKFAGRFDYFGQCLVSEGYAVARIDYRGKSGYGEKFSRASDFQQATGQPHDLLDGIDWLAAQGWIDSDRVIACGVYISGLVGLRAAVEARQFKALINIDVPTFLYEPKLKSHGSPYQTEEQMIAALGGAKAADAFMKAQDPTPVWKQLSIPSLNYYPRVWRDNSMSSYGRRLEPILKDLGQPYVMKLQGNLNDLRGQSKETADLVSKHPRGKPRGICSNPPCPIRSFLSLW